MKIAVIDNYDSFIQIIIYYLRSIEQVDVFVMKNDTIDFETLNICDCIILSPGPGIPKESGQLMKVIERYYLTKPLFGVCLGHQALYEFFGGTLQNITPPMHGISSTLSTTRLHFLWENLSTPINIGHYHSWVANPETKPEELDILAFDEKENIMAFEHKTLPIVGIQFHPESILTTQGNQIFINWLEKNKSLTQPKT